MKSYMENIPYPGHKSFLKDREQVEDEPRAGRSSTLKTDDNLARVGSLVRSDRRLMLRMINCELNLNQVYCPSNFNTGFGHDKSVRQDGSREPHD